MSLKNSNLLYRIGAIVFSFFAGVVIANAFFIPSPCDSDNVNLWCRTHPLTIVDIIGGVLVAAGALWTIKYWWNAEGSIEDRTWLEWVGVGLFFIGAVLMWAK